MKKSLLESLYEAMEDEYSADIEYSPIEDEEEIDVIDADAADEEDISPSYEGRIVCQCPVCKTLVFKTDDDELQVCPTCQSEDLEEIGQIAPVESVEIDVVEDNTSDETDAADEDDVLTEENIITDTGLVDWDEDQFLDELERERGIRESVEGVTITTEDDIINVTDKDDDEGLEVTTVAKESTPDESDIIGDDIVVDEPQDEVIIPLEEPEEDADLDIPEVADEDKEEEPEEDVDIDVDSFDEAANESLKKQVQGFCRYITESVEDKGTHTLCKGRVVLRENKRLINKPITIKLVQKENNLFEAVDLTRKTFNKITLKGKLQ